MNKLTLLVFFVVFAVSGSVLPGGVSFFRGGNGTPADPFQITNVDELQAMNDNLAASYVLANDIDASATVGWNSGAGFAPIGNPFSGTFDGQDYTIFGLFINRPSESAVGLFGSIGSADVNIKNVSLVDIDITGLNGVGGLVGCTSGSITRCYVSGRVRGAQDVGGLVGFHYAYNGDIWNSGTDVNVTATGLNAGGIAGSLAGSYSMDISILTRPGTSREKALSVDWSATATTEASPALSQREMSRGGSAAGDGYVAGLVGWTNGPIQNSYATGNVVGRDYIGGLVGFIHWYGAIQSSYAAGSVTGTAFVGGLVGDSYGGVILNSYWDTLTSGQLTSSGGTGETTANMMRQSKFAEWDFAGIWGIQEDAGYPFLLWEGPPPDTTSPVPDVAELGTVIGQCSVMVATKPTATDDRDGAITGATIDPINYPSQGEYVIHWTFADQAGNVATQEQKVIVVDTTVRRSASPPQSVSRRLKGKARIRDGSLSRPWTVAMGPSFQRSPRAKSSTTAAIPSWDPAFTASPERRSP